MKTIAAASLLASLTLAAHVAHADTTTVATGTADADVTATTTATVPSRPTLSATVGLFTPVGEAGIEYATPLGDYVDLGLGAGIALGGPQVSIMPRVHLGSRRFAFTLGAGLSAGGLTIPTFSFDGPSMDTHTDLAIWANGELGIEAHSDGGFSARLFAGIGRVVGDAGDCAGDDCASVVGITLPYAGLSLGHTL